MGVLAMAGDGLRRPLNAPPAGIPGYGVQPGAPQIFQQIIVFGGGVFVYSGPPAAGNLIASVTNKTIDPYGLNATLPGTTGYSNAAGVFYAVQNGGTGASPVTAYYTASSAAGPYTLQGFIRGDGSAMTISSSNGLILSTGGSSGAVIATLSSTLSGGVPVTSIDRTVLAAGNSTTAADITNAWTIPANDGANGAKYTIETHVTATTGQTTVETLTLGLDLNNGTLVPLATLGTAFNGGALAATYEIPVRLILVPGAGTSAADAQVTLSGPLGDSSANRLATNSANMAGRSNGTAFDTTADNTIALYAVWGGAGGSQQTAGTRWSEFTRSGQN
jgi:hypothetical protein